MLCFLCVYVAIFKGLSVQRRGQSRVSVPSSRSQYSTTELRVLCSFISIFEKFLLKSLIYVFLNLQVTNLFQIQGTNPKGIFESIILTWTELLSGLVDFITREISVMFKKFA
ncbi:hypothetical protein HA466_0090410 [Hirschfeldia incana]|nr:hypothetical protein HA466_0090410 [Hirschfeldia incana]